MAISSDKLNKFFSTHKVGNFSELNNIKNKKSTTESVSNPLASATESVSNPLASATESVSNPLASATESVSNPLASTTESVSNPLASTTESVSNPLASTTESVSNPLASTTESVSNPLASATESVSNPLASATESVSNPLASATESVSNPLASATESVSNPLASTTESVSNPLASTTESVSNPLASATESVSNPLASATESVSNPLASFSEKELMLLCFLSDHLTSPNSILTSQVKSSNIIYALSISPIRLRNLIFRIKKKQGFSIEENKSSRHAYRVFKFEKNILKLIKKYNNNENALIYNSNNINTNIIINKNDKENSKLEETSNQNNNIKTRTTFISNNPKEIFTSLETQNSNILSQSESTQKTNDKIKYEELPEEWKNINYHFLDDLHFKQHHIIGLYKLDVLEPEVVQESIEHFAYGIKHNPDNYTKYTDPLKVFYGSLRKGKPWTESTYKSTKEMATEDLIQRRKSEKRKIANETCKLVEEMEKENYEKWYYSLSEEEKKEIKEKHKLQESGIFNIFDEKIYKLHYGKYVMEEYKDPSELALEEFIAKKKRKEEAEAKRIKRMLQEGGMIKEYYKWAGEIKEEEIKEITEEEGGMTERGQNKMIIYYAKQIAK